MALSFLTDIRPLFREGDVKCMKPAGVRLDDAEWMCVEANAAKVYGAVAAGEASFGRAAGEGQGGVI